MLYIFIKTIINLYLLSQFIKQNIAISSFDQIRFFIC